MRKESTSESIPSPLEGEPGWGDKSHARPVESMFSPPPLTPSLGGEGDMRKSAFCQIPPRDFECLLWGSCLKNNGSNPGHAGAGNA